MKDCARTLPTSEQDLPPPHKGAVRRGEGGRESLSVTLKVVTRIIGGGVVPRKADTIDYIRPGSVRGHLRFWWRALQNPGLTSAELYQKESALWGRAAVKQQGGRSAVELRVSVSNRVEPNSVGPRDQDNYVTWPTRKTNETPAGETVDPGTVFTLALTFPKDQEANVKDALRAWILFGGYGSRTRRGAGSLTVTGADAARWLPTWDEQPDLFLANINRLFSRPRFGLSSNTVSQTPNLLGAELLATLQGAPVRDASAAWHRAITWLRDFRQGSSDKAGNRAREPGDGGRPGISNWPEADKVRRLSDGQWAHAPRYNAQPAWPRAGFGLPIIGRFQRSARGGGHYKEPADFTISWVDGQGTFMNRLASPLIIKALPLADGRFVPCALWLQRALPDGHVGLVSGATIEQRSQAPFDRMLGAGDRPLFSPMRKASLRTAFVDWLVDTGRAEKVQP